MKIFSPAHAILLLTQLTACASLNPFAQPPKISIKDVQIVSPSITEATLEFTFDIENPNPVSLSARQLSYGLELAGKPVTTGALESGLQMPARGATTLKVPLTVVYRELFGSTSELFTEGTAPYVIKGALAVGPFEAPYSHSGQLELPHLPKVSLKALRARNLRSLAPAWTLDLEVENPNAFPIPLDGFGYALSLGDRPALEGKTTIIELAARHVTPISLPLELPLGEAGALAAQWLKGTRQIPYSFSAKLDVPRTEGIGISQSGSLPLPRK